MRSSKSAAPASRRGRNDRVGRIVTVTPNAALDRTLWIAEPLSPGSRQIVREEFCQAGGKGVNVSRVLELLGASVRTIVVLGGATGEAIAADLRTSGLASRVVRAEGESRTCTEILVDGDSSITQLHGVGVHCTPETERELLATVVEELEGASWLALCGSLPTGLSDGFYASAIARARQLGVPSALDASGTPLSKGLTMNPDLVRVTIAEVTGALGVSAGQAGASLANASSWWVLSDGPNEVRSGTAQSDAWRATPPPVRVRNTIGCGDAMLAGLLFHSSQQRSKLEALRHAIGLAAADAEAFCAGRTDVERAARLARGVTIRRSARPPRADLETKAAPDPKIRRRPKRVPLSRYSPTEDARQYHRRSGA